MNTSLSRQTFCLDKHTFVATKDLFCRDKHVCALSPDKTLVTTKLFVVTNVLSAQKYFVATIFFATKLLRRRRLLSRQKTNTCLSRRFFYLWRFPPMIPDELSPSPVSADGPLRRGSKRLQQSDHLQCCCHSCPPPRAE